MIDNIIHYLVSIIYNRHLIPDDDLFVEFPIIYNIIKLFFEIVQVNFKNQIELT